jgi:hypothetical protein
MDTVAILFDKKDLILEININGKLEYEVPLLGCSSPAQILDALFQVHSKNWATPELMYKLMEAFDDASSKVHGSGIQGTYCPFGKAKTVSWKK